MQVEGAVRLVPVQEHRYRDDRDMGENCMRWRVRLVKPEAADQRRFYRLCEHQVANQNRRERERQLELAAEHRLGATGLADGDDSTGGQLGDLVRLGDGDRRQPRQGAFQPGEAEGGV